MKQPIIDKSPVKFDFLFIGLGAANCLLILRLNDKDLLKGKAIGIIEPDSKNKNDRTFCFWATDKDVLNLEVKNLVSFSWENLEINSIIKQTLSPLKYHHIKGLDIYEKTKNILSNYEVSFFKSFLKENPLIKPNYFEISLENEKITANKVFDSRPPIFKITRKYQSHLLQSFYGWKIKSKSKTFDPSTIVMMDFNVPHHNFTQFIYILPYTDDTALIEITRFGKQNLEQGEAEILLSNYLKNLAIVFEILEYEHGVIPMSSASLETPNYGPNWINMGARANMLKSTTGYAFHAMADDALVQLDAIKNDQLPFRKARKKRFVFYDRLLLKILSESPEYGKIIFETLFKKVPIKTVLSFLSEKTSFSKELLIFSKLPKRIFIKTAINDLLQHIVFLPVLVLPFLFTILTLILSFLNLQSISWGILTFGFLTVGLSHGALDHLTSKKIINTKYLFYFIINYLFKSAVLGLIWFILPDVGLLIFITYSTWHFGQADFKEWGLKQGWGSFLWGIIVLMTILFFHFNELNLILQQIPNLESVNLINKITEKQLIPIQLIIAIVGIALGLLQKSKYMILTLTYLLISSMLPLLVSFGIYFIGQHSLNGWRHLTIGLNQSSSSLGLKSLPFSIGGALIIITFLLSSDQNYVGIFFIILSCLSIPHVISMHQFYSKFKNKFS